VSKHVKNQTFYNDDLFVTGPNMNIKLSRFGFDFAKNKFLNKILNRTTQKKKELTNELFFKSSFQPTKQALLSKFKDLNHPNQTESIERKSTDFHKENRLRVV